MTFSLRSADGGTFNLLEADYIQNPTALSGASPEELNTRNLAHLSTLACTVGTGELYVERAYAYGGESVTINRTHDISYTTGGNARECS